MKFILLAALAFFAIASAKSTDVKPGDFRDEFDQLLAEYAQEVIRDGEAHLLRLDHEITAFRQKPTKEVKDHLIVELELTVAQVTAIDQYLEGELKRTDLNILEKFLFDSFKVNSAILIQDLQKAEKEIKAITV